MPLILGDFENLLRVEDEESIVREKLFATAPFVFEQNSASYELLKKHLAEALGVGPDAIRIMGSALTGFSMSPETYPRAFHDRSDIDVVVVSESMFDAAWASILRWHSPRRGQLPDHDNSWMGGRRRELYWGWLAPTLIKYAGISLPASLKPLRDLSHKWFEAFQGLGRYSEFSRRAIQGRLYRSWDHAVIYHASGLRQIKTKLLKRAQQS